MSDMNATVVSDVTKLQNLKAGDKIVITVNDVVVYDKAVPVGKKILNGVVVVNAPLTNA